jgi:hypothetical protein
MNITKIAGLYPYFLNALAVAPSDSLQRSIQQLLELKVQNSLSRAGGRYSVKVKDMGAKARGCATTAVDLEVYCPARVFAWGLSQQPATNTHHDLAPELLWSAMTGDFTTEDGVFTLRFGAEADFATLLRGMRAYERKQAKYSRKLRAQLQAYHAQQQQRLAMAAAAPVAAASAPAYCLADARTAMGVLLGYGAATVKRALHDIRMAVGFSGGEEVAL